MSAKKNDGLTRAQRYLLNHRGRARKLDARNKKAYRVRNRDFVFSRKSGPCIDCGGLFPPVCMDFDHVRGEKFANVSKMVNTCEKLSRIEDEIAKCDLVCSNCHRIRTEKRRVAAAVQ